ncbi:MAG TPA: GNAT family N-acetyltransferase [Dinghuibacter sp.]|uniref:GNAT family N-acetyltransferase n=1 Tax=Dinghuibacter sp. TaxID=2024697 RepID=UPI002C7294AB|nr:GNAT family N-acetyltransferase [Dinghuibacter sp.]HTJ12771.1 GNAT family N-acetyltransferase [Dinghuibacter sp.]
MGIFLASGDEIELIVNLVNTAYRGEGAGWTNETHLLQGPRTDAAEVGRLLNEGMILTFVDGGLLGCVYLQPQADALYMGLLSVRPDRQGAGIGKKLMGAAVDFARERGYGRIRITVLSRRPELIAWYERHGYVRTGEALPFPWGDRLELIVLERAILG